jgi:hypothetical protein
MDAGHEVCSLIASEEKMSAYIGKAYQYYRLFPMMLLDQSKHKMLSSQHSDIHPWWSSEGSYLLIDHVTTRDTYLVHPDGTLQAISIGQAYADQTGEELRQEIAAGHLIATNQSINKKGNDMSGRKIKTRNDDTRPPQEPKYGQLWYDPVLCKVRAWNGKEWAEKKPGDVAKERG